MALCQWFDFAVFLVTFQNARTSSLKRKRVVLDIRLCLCSFSNVCFTAHVRTLFTE